MDDEYIQELIDWTHPHISDGTPFQYTEKENVEMLRLPRKECLFSYMHDDIPELISFSYRHRDGKSDTRSILDSGYVTLLLHIRFADVAARPYTRKCMDYVQPYTCIHGT